MVNNVWFCFFLRRLRQRLLPLMLLLSAWLSVLVSGLAWPTLAQAEVRIFATVPEWGALAKAIGGDQVTVYTATRATQDPHRIDAKPSLMAAVRRADFVVSVGAGLESAWLPLLLRDSGNGDLQPGGVAHWQAAAHTNRLQVPTVIDRSQGDVHAEGNPHLHLHPHNVVLAGDSLSEQLAARDADNAAHYRANWKAFKSRWLQAMTRWQAQGAALRGVRVVSHHASFSYLANWLGLVEVGMLEPKPGIEPTRRHLQSLLAQQQAAPVQLVLYTPYQPATASQWFAENSRAKALLLPYTVGGSPQAVDLFSLFDDTLTRLNTALHP